MFAKRKIDVTLSIGKGQYGEIPGDPVKISGMRVRADIVSCGGETQGECNLRIYGLPISTINQFTAIGPNAGAIMGMSLVQVEAGDEGGKMSMVFLGNIRAAYGDFSEAPEVALCIQAFSAGAAQLKPARPTSINGTADVADLMREFAEEMGFAFENNGVSVMLNNHCCAGTTLDKIKDCARAAQINYSTDNRVLAIWPEGGNRKGAPVVISPSTGLVGYPTFSSWFLVIRSLFLPDILQGGLISVEDSQITQANGKWVAVGVQHALESETPGGAWFTDLMARSVQG